MNFKKVLISELKPAAYNPRKNLSEKDPEYQRIKKSIETFGYVDPVIVNADYTVIGGHQRLKVLKGMGEASIDVVVVDLPKDQEKALNVALNKITGDWDMQQLSIVLSELKEADFDISITGFSDDELKKIDEELFGKKVTLDTEPQISRAEELRKEWGTELGQMWQCGDHRVICGDCTDPAVVSRVMQGEKADISITDPPYNVNEDYEGYDDALTEDEYKKNTVAWFSLLQKHSKDQIVTPGCYNLARWLRLFDPYHVAPWIKTNSMTNGKVSRFWCWEPILFFGKSKRARSNDVFDSPIGSQKGVGGHPCPKPLKLWADLIENYSDKSGVVLDSFLGSGTTMIACENLGRKCRGVEVDPGYVAVCLERYKTTFNKMPVLLEGD